ncbi:HTH-type transcriptional repressor KstR2 [Baekduia alba]|uniref:TetR/AcrR family transcriptional regulator n=1 Tax=Baekduia alba TaxID=2997333 RepID=UPI0023408C4A|nr:TetR/AcrR family transcriptional regulator [Baekduia alba]WCB95109.1 HTH-type transcriptional repressor KstR2 [Baekduia alba]
MPTRPDRPALRARYDRRRAEVVVGAARVFAERGYDQTSVPQLAEELGIAAGSLYHYFGGKEQLLIAICDQLMDPLLGEARAVLADEDADAGDQLRALVRLWVGHVIAHRDHMLVFLQERHVIDHGDQWAEVRRGRKQFEQLVEGLLARIDAEGRARLGDARLTLSALLGMVNHTAQWYRPRGRLDADAIADGYVDLVLAG